MTRSHLALFLVLGVPVALYAAVAAPPDPPLGPAWSYPTTIGTKWVYHCTESGPRAREPLYEVEVVTGAVECDGDWFITIQQLQGEDPGFRELWVSTDGLSTRRRRDLDHSGRVEPWPPISWHSTTVGETRTEDRPADHKRVTTTNVGTERLFVPAGTFRANRTDVAITEYEPGTKRTLMTISGSIWFAHGVGLIRFDLSCDTIPFRRVKELISYTPGPRR